MSDLTHLFEQTAAQRGALGTDDSLLSLRQLIDAARDCDTDLASAQAHVAVLQKRQNELVSDLIPAAMDAAGVTGFTAPDGSSVSLQDLVSGTLNAGRDEPAGDHEARRRAALAWLNENGHGGVVKRTLEIPLPRHTSPDTVKRVRDVLVRNGVPFEEVEDVHHSTLASLLRELAEQHQGVLPPRVLELFRAQQFRRAKLVRPKKRK